MNFSLVLGFMKRNGEQSQHSPSDFTWVLRALDKFSLLFGSHLVLCQMDLIVFFFLFR